MGSNQKLLILPIAVRACRALSMAEGGGSEVIVTYKGGTEPFYQHGTENCARCCQWSIGQPATNASSNDYDASGKIIF